MFQAALQHLPNAPTQRVAAMSQLPIIGDMVTPRTAILAGSHGWDSFQRMYQKLDKAEQIILAGKGALQELTGKTAEHAVGAGGGAPAHPVIDQLGTVNGQPAIWDGHGWAPAPPPGPGRSGRGGRGGG
jgi:hypothetical protein